MAESTFRTFLEFMEVLQTNKKLWNKKSLGLFFSDKKKINDITESKNSAIHPTIGGLSLSHQGNRRNSYEIDMKSIWNSIKSLV